MTFVFTPTVVLGVAPTPVVRVDVQPELGLVIRVAAHMPAFTFIVANNGSRCRRGREGQSAGSNQECRSQEFHGASPFLLMTEASNVSSTRWFPNWQAQFLRSALRSVGNSLMLFVVRPSAMASRANSARSMIMSVRSIAGFSVAALLAVSGAAIAQEGGKGASPGAAPGNAGAEKMAPNSSGAGDKTAPGSSSEKGARSEQPSMKGAEKAPSKTEKNSNERAQSTDKSKTDQGSTAQKKDSGSTQDRAAKENQDKSSSGASSGEQGKTNATTDTGTKTTASLSQEQRTKVQSAFKGHASAKVNVNVDARIGVAVPRDVVLVAIPEDVVVIVPEWRRYKYIVIGDHICIVDPDTFVIIDVIAAV
jgi:hypothetical protein